MTQSLSEIIDIKNTSYLRFLTRVGNISVNEGKEWLSPSNLSKITIPDSDDDWYFTVPGHLIRRLDLISMEVYGTVFFWHFIALANNIKDPWNDIEIGSILRIPTVLTVMRVVDKYVKADS